MMFGVQRSPEYIVFGNGQRHSAPRYAKQFGSVALIVTDERMRESADISDLVRGLSAQGVSSSIFHGVLPELPVECLDAGVDQGRKLSADVVIGVGGGSCIDAAKVVALLLRHGGRPADYYGEFKVPGPVLPVIAVPTTSGTGSEVTPVAVVGDHERAVKVGIASPYLIPAVAICDPELTYSCPATLTAVSGADALTHAIEAFTNTPRDGSSDLAHEHVFVGKNVLSDHHALLAIRHISKSLERAYNDVSDRDARESLMLGSLGAGLAFGVAGTAAAHAIQYPVGALTNTPHGAGVAVMLPYVMQFNAPYCGSALAEIATAMGVSEPGASISENAQAAIEHTARLMKAIGIPETLESLGLSPSDVEWVASQALSATRLVKNNPRPLDLAGMRMLVKAAFDGDRPALQDTQQTKAS